MSSQTHTHTHKHTHTRRLIRRLPSYSLCTARTSLPFVYVLLLATFIFLFTPFILALLSPSPSLSLALYLPLSPLAACLPIMELICLAHKECLSISAGLSVPREMVTNHTNMCICSVYIIVFLIVCVCVKRRIHTSFWKVFLFGLFWGSNFVSASLFWFSGLKKTFFSDRRAHLHFIERSRRSRKLSCLCAALFSTS